MHVPAYVPVECGVQAVEKRGVAMSFWKTDCIVIVLGEEGELPDPEPWSMSIPSMDIFVCLGWIE